MIHLPKWTELVIALYNLPAEQRYCERLCKRTGMTTKHIRDLTAQLEKIGILKRQQGSKIRYIELTETGQELAELFLKIYPALRR